MSLVAYADSGEESEYDDQNDDTVVPVKTLPQELLTNGHISEKENELNTNVDKSTVSLFSFLPKPKNTHTAVTANEVAEDDIQQAVVPRFNNLPAPKTVDTTKAIIEEVEDEFLLKKPARQPVQITIPSLKDFNDVDKDLSSSKVKQQNSKNKTATSGLLTLLPTAKSEQNFAKKTDAQPTIAQHTKNSNVNVTHRFIPDAVQQRRPAHNTEAIDGINVPTQKSQRKPSIKVTQTLVDCSSSSGEESDAEVGGDFFSLSADDKLPEVCGNEIKALVEKRAAKMAAVTSEYLSAVAETKEQQQAQNPVLITQQYPQQQLDEEAMQALAGSSAKRHKKHQDIQVLDITSKDVLLDKNEWMRSALASSTTFQPTGQLVDEEPASGTRRKHQITYLAHMAKANEAELQAMWATNRHNRRATQSKYGF